MSPPEDGLPPLREVIARLHLSARKSLGQNYILDFNLLRRIALAGGPLVGVHVLEVGPGPGGLTRALLQSGAQTVTVIERDERFRPALEEIAARYPDRLRMIFADALTVPFGEIAVPGSRVIANLPYNIATRLLVQWLGEAPWPPWYERLLLMLQREVAERLTAAPGNKAYGRLSVLAQWRARARSVLHLPPRAFTPPPKVSSTLLEIVPRPVASQDFAPAHLERLTAAAFGQRRKMLRRALRGLVADPDALLANAGIAPQQRAEMLQVADFTTLAAALARLEAQG